jgi:hypothetical protein
MNEKEQITDSSSIIIYDAQFVKRKGLWFDTRWSQRLEF